MSLARSQVKKTSLIPRKSSPFLSWIFFFGKDQLEPETAVEKKYPAQKHGLLSTDINDSTTEKSLLSYKLHSVSKSLRVNPPSKIAMLKVGNLKSFYKWIVELMQDSRRSSDFMQPDLAPACNYFYLQFLIITSSVSHAQDKSQGSFNMHLNYIGSNALRLSLVSENTYMFILPTYLTGHLVQFNYGWKVLLG